MNQKFSLNFSTSLNKRYLYTDTLKLLGRYLFKEYKVKYKIQVKLQKNNKYF